tara:strand:- start:76 stop:432 length:357 start_codon:yes stop_codon:yes gene_type:complete
MKSQIAEMDVPKYRYVEESNEENMPIQIMDGTFEGIVVQYGRVFLEEKNGDLHFNYDYDIISNPDNIEMCPELKDAFTAILVSVIEEQVGNVPEDSEILKEDNSEAYRESDTTESPVQ